MFHEFNQPIKVTRRTEGHYENGFYKDGVEEEFIIQTSVQPTWREDVVILPQGRRGETTYTLFCSNKILKETDNAPLRKSDLVEIYGEVHEVFNVEVWQNGVISHYKAITIKLENQHVA